MTKRTIIFSLVFIIGIVSTISCDRKTYNTVSSIVTKNSKASEKKPYLILISLDGFRWDYVEKYKPPHLINFIKNGINSESSFNILERDKLSNVSIFDLLIGLLSVIMTLNSL